MNRKNLQRIARIRLSEANALLRAKRYDGAYYLAGYAIECALKACIAKRTRRHDFPDKNLAKKVFIHDLVQLMNIAELKATFNVDKTTIIGLEDSWNIVKDWSEESRYLIGITRATAQDMITAVSDNSNGILPWLEKYW